MSGIQKRQEIEIKCKRNFFFYSSCLLFPRRKKKAVESLPKCIIWNSYNERKKTSISSYVHMNYISQALLKYTHSQQQQ